MAKSKKLPSGNWNVVLFVGFENGKRKYKSFTAKTKKEVEFLAANYNLNRKEENSNDKTLLKTAFRKYIESKNNILSPTTISGYNAILRNNLQDIMDLPLSSINQEKIQISINHEAINHSPKSVRNMHGLLSAVLSVYMPNMSLHTRLPQKIKTEIYVPTDEDVKALLNASVGTDLHIAILLASVGTLRRSEICALTNKDIFDNGININKALVRTEKGEWTIKTTKTVAGTRFVELPKQIIDLSRTKESVLCEMTPNSLTDRFISLTKSVLGHSFRFHDLRHYSASVLHTMGVPDVYIMARGGWESRDTLNRVYTHILSQEQKKINENICNHFENNLLMQKDMKIKVLYEDNIKRGYANCTTIEVPDDNYTVLIDIDYEQRLSEAKPEKRKEVKESIIIMSYKNDILTAVDIILGIGETVRKTAIDIPTLYTHDLLFKSLTSQTINPT